MRRKWQYYDDGKMTRNRSSSTTTPCACRNSTPVITAVMISTQCICLHVEMACLCRPIDPSNISGTNQKVCPFVDTQEDHSGYATFEAYPVFFPLSSMFIDWPVGQFSGYAVTYAYPLNVAFKSTALWMRVVCARVRRVGGVPALAHPLSERRQIQTQLPGYRRESGPCCAAVSRVMSRNRRSRCVPGRLITCSACRKFILISLHEWRTVDLIRARRETPIVL